MFYKKIIATILIGTPFVAFGQTATSSLKDSYDSQGCATLQNPCKEVEVQYILEATDEALLKTLLITDTYTGSDTSDFYRHQLAIEPVSSITLFRTAIVDRIASKYPSDISAHVTELDRTIHGNKGQYSYLNTVLLPYTWHPLTWNSLTDTATWNKNIFNAYIKKDNGVTNPAGRYWREGVAVALVDDLDSQRIKLIPNTADPRVSWYNQGLLYGYIAANNPLKRVEIFHRLSVADSQRLVLRLWKQINYFDDTTTTEISYPSIDDLPENATLRYYNFSYPASITKERVLAGLLVADYSAEPPTETSTDTNSESTDTSSGSTNPDWVWNGSGWVWTGSLPVLATNPTPIDTTQSPQPTTPSNQTPNPQTFASGLVPCSGADCQACDLLQLIQNLINAAITLATALAIIGLAWNGFQMVVKGGGDPLVHEVFRRKLKNIVIGFVLMLGAWVIVDSVMKLFLNDQQFGTWNKIQCVAQPTATKGQSAPLPTGTVNTGGNVVGDENPTPTPVTPGTPTTPTPAPGGVITPVLDPTPNTPPVTNTGGETISGSVSGMVYICYEFYDLKAAGLTCKQAQCYAERSTALRLVALNGLYSLRITEAIPPTMAHKADCHRSVTCVDATVSMVTNATEAVAFFKEAQSKGIRAVWEGASCTTRDQIRAAGAPAFCKTDNGFDHISGTHYSLYSN